MTAGMSQRPTLLASTALAVCGAFASAPVARLQGEVNAAMGDDARDDLADRSVDSAAMLPYWDKVDALIDGIEAVRARGTDFLPKFVDEEQRDYNFRLKMTKMTNVYRDIIEGLASKPFEETIKLINTKGEADDIPPPREIVEFCYDVDGAGNDLTVFAGAAFFNAVNSAIDWIHVDFPKRDPNVRSIADARVAGIRPYWSHILARNVLDVRSKVIGGNETLVYFRVFEPGTPDKIREFERGENGAVTWTLYRKEARANGAKPTWVVDDQGDITIGVIPMVPVITGRRDGRSWKFYPAMKDAADLQIELYQQESGLKFAKTLTAYPMLAANGITPPKDAKGNPEKLAVGPNRVLYSSADAQGKVGNWGYVEPGSESLKFLASDIGETIQQLRELGRQPLTAQSGNITVITAAVAAGKARSAVKAWALRLQNSLENALLLTAKWINSSYDPSVHVFTEFDDYMEGDDLDALDKMRANNDISRETLWEEMRRRTVLSSSFTAERETKRLLAELPSDVTNEGMPPQ